MRRSRFLFLAMIGSSAITICMILSSISNLSHELTSNYFETVLLPKFSVPPLARQLLSATSSGEIESTAAEHHRPSTFINHRIAIVTMYFGSAAALKPFTYQNKLEYARRHGYIFLDASEDPFLIAAWETEEVKRNILQSKFFVLQHYLASGKYDWLFWSDSDAMFLNRSKSLHDAGVVDDRFDMTVSVGSAFDFHWGKVVNTGHFSLRASGWGRRFAEQAWFDYRPHSGAQCPPNPFGPLNNWLGVCSGAGEQLNYWLGDQVSDKP